MIYVLAGSGRIVVGDDEVALTSGEVVVAPAQIPHQVRAAANEGLDTLVAMPATLRTFRPDASEIQQPWHTQGVALGPARLASPAESHWPPC